MPLIGRSGNKNDCFHFIITFISYHVYLYVQGKQITDAFRHNDMLFV
jgi:hypothetical protein